MSDRVITEQKTVGVSIEAGNGRLVFKASRGPTLARFQFFNRGNYSQPVVEIGVDDHALRDLGRGLLEMYGEGPTDTGIREMGKQYLISRGWRREGERMYTIWKRGEGCEEIGCGFWDALKKQTADDWSARNGR